MHGQHAANSYQSCAVADSYTGVLCLCYSEPQVQTHGVEPAFLKGEGLQDPPECPLSRLCCLSSNCIWQVCDMSWCMALQELCPEVLGGDSPHLQVQPCYAILQHLCANS